MTDEALEVAARLVAERQSKHAISAAIGVSESCLTAWLKKARKGEGSAHHKRLLALMKDYNPEQKKPTDKRRCLSWLAEPLSPDEQQRVKQMAREHAALLRYAGGKLCNKYWFVSKEDIFSCINAAFVKACRAWQPKRGTFSTCFLFFANGECLHWIRDKNFAVKSPGKVKDIARKAQKLHRQGMKPSAILKTLNISPSELRDALVSVRGVFHEIKGFDLHCDQGMTPMERLEAEEEQAERLERARELMPDFDERVEAMEQELLLSA